jgi:hypothetical protein
MEAIAKRRVVVADDSRLMRRMLSDALASRSRSRELVYQVLGLVMVPCASVSCGGNWLTASTPSRMGL